jgi:raffinose/stachyose/melibiose transport system substrate-binding protein
LFVLADFHNSLGRAADWAEKYTANQAKYATTPAALRGFQHLQGGPRRGPTSTRTSPSSEVRAALKALATAKGAHYPMLTFAVGTIRLAEPGQAR